jgi:hypothetical protein
MTKERQELLARLKGSYAKEIGRAIVGGQGAGPAAGKAAASSQGEAAFAVSR